MGWFNQHPGGITPQMEINYLLVKEFNAIIILELIDISFFFILVNRLSDLLFK